MKNSLFAVSSILFITCIGSHKMNNNWPDLSKYQATIGRAATEEDINAGRAVFILKNEDTPIGNPINIDLPQYAIHIDQETKNEEHCIVIQAEEADGKEYIGCILIKENKFMVGFKNEFKLLGKSKPIK